jgi:hypothetical protein
MTSSKKYGTDKSMVPDDIPCYIYGPHTGNTNLQRHLRREHAEEYDNAILEHKWSYKLSGEMLDASTQNPRSMHDHVLPSFSLVAFLDQLIHFIVADDQVSPNGSRVLSHSHKSSVNSCCRMPQVSKVVHDPLQDSC